MKGHIPTYLRSDETWSRYKKEPRRDLSRCFMCEKEYVVVREYEHWLIIENNFPYDAVAITHHMLIPKRHVAFSGDDELWDEQAELDQIEAQLNEEGEYDCIMKNFAVGQSQPAHLHYHLLTWKRR